MPVISCVFHSYFHITFRWDVCWLVQGKDLNPCLQFVINARADYEEWQKKRSLVKTLVSGPNFAQTPVGKLVKLCGCESMLSPFIEVRLAAVALSV